MKPLARKHALAVDPRHPQQARLAAQDRSGGRVAVGKDDERAAAHLWQAAVGERLAIGPAITSELPEPPCMRQQRETRPSSQPGR